MLTIKNLHAKINETMVLKGLNLTIKPGEIHAIMGPNGSGKTTLSKVLAGDTNYTVTAGEIALDNQNLLLQTPEERALNGLFLGFQYPVEIAGINNSYFLRTALNLRRKKQGLPPLDIFEFSKLIEEKLALVNMDEQLLDRSINEGFSGGEKKRNEILQLLLLNPKLAILDETDSGLDIDALKSVANGITHFHAKDNALLLITHYQRLLDYVKPDHVHILYQGKIIQSGDMSLVGELEKNGYHQLIAEIKNA